jgi:hypothetical protein
VVSEFRAELDRSEPKINNPSFNKILNMKTSRSRKSIGRSPLLLGLLLIPLALAWLALSPVARAVCQEGCDLSNGNTFLGDDALHSNTTGFQNTATASHALFNNVAGYSNTATGFEALFKGRENGSELSIDIHWGQFMACVNGKTVAHRVFGRNLSCAEPRGPARSNLPN